jgi:hypothetical protein
MARPKKSAVKRHEPIEQGDVRLYTLEVFLLSGPAAGSMARRKGTEDGQERKTINA